MKNHWLFTAITVFTLTAAPMFGGPAGKHHLTIADGDGGQVEAITLSDHEGPLSHHGGAVVAHPRLVAAFLGDSWGSEHNAPLADSILDHLRSLSGRADFGAMDEYGVAAAAIPVTSIRITTDRDDLSDLDVQRALAGAAAQLSGVDENTIVMVILAPELRSHLEEARGNADYAAYHSHRQIGETDVRYAVVSAATPANALPGVLARTVRHTILNPEGDGWY